MSYVLPVFIPKSYIFGSFKGIHGYFERWFLTQTCLFFSPRDRKTSQMPRYTWRICFKKRTGCGIKERDHSGKCFRGSCIIVGQGSPQKTHRHLMTDVLLQRIWVISTPRIPTTSITSRQATCMVGYIKGSYLLWLHEIIPI